MEKRLLRFVFADEFQTLELAKKAAYLSLVHLSAANQRNGLDLVQRVQDTSFVLAVCCFVLLCDWQWCISKKKSLRNCRVFT